MRISSSLREIMPFRRITRCGVTVSLLPNQFRVCRPAERATNAAHAPTIAQFEPKGKAPAIAGFQATIHRATTRPIVKTVVRTYHCFHEIRHSKTIACSIMVVTCPSGPKPNSLAQFGASLDAPLCWRRVKGRTLLVRSTPHSHRRDADTPVPRCLVPFICHSPLASNSRARLC